VTTAQCDGTFKQASHFRAGTGKPPTPWRRGCNVPTRAATSRDVLPPILRLGFFPNSRDALQQGAPRNPYLASDEQPGGCYWLYSLSSIGNLDAFQCIVVFGSQRTVPELRCPLSQRLCRRRETGKSMGIAAANRRVCECSLSAFKERVMQK
jgi:hypothetical protein